VQVGGGWDLKIESFLGPVKWHRAIRFYAQEPTREVSGPILWGMEEQVHKGTYDPPRAAQVHKGTYDPPRAAQVHKGT
jgi:hypothetical protein